MDICIYSVKANSQAGNITVYITTTQRPKSQDNQIGISKIHAFCWKIKNTPKMLILKSLRPSPPYKLLQLNIVAQGRVQLEYSNHISKVGVKLKC